MASALIFLFLAGVVILVIRSKGAHGSQSRSHRTVSDDTDKLQPLSDATDELQNLADDTGGLQPFNAKSAKTQPSEPVLHGSAYVVDGDTVVIQKTQIRLFGVDAPEINHPYGRKAKWALVSLCKGQKVRAEVVEQDAHGRVVARCYLQDGRDLSAEIVKLGLAIDWPKFSGGKYRLLETADARRKLWLADARQKGRMHVWEKFEANHKARMERD